MMREIGAAVAVEVANQRLAYTRYFIMPVAADVAQ